MEEEEESFERPEREAPTAEEASVLAEMERTFGIAKKWGYDGDRESAFQAKLNDARLGEVAKAYTDVVFRCFYLAGSGSLIDYERDVLEKYLAQVELSNMTQTKLSDLIARYFANNAIMQLRLTTFAGQSYEAPSLVEYGMRQGAAQLLDMARGKWSEVQIRRSRTVQTMRDAV
jgi:hypothetical protein